MSRIYSSRFDISNLCELDLHDTYTISAQNAQTSASRGGGGRRETGGDEHVRRCYLVSRLGDVYYGLETKAS